MDKLYQRINYENSPSKKTPLSEANLNKMDKALDDLDNRIIEQDAAFAKSIEEEGKKIEEVNGKVSEIAGTVATLTQSKSDAIVCSASGERITATDSADAGFEQFKTFGKSVQEKTSGKNLAWRHLTESFSTNGVTFTVDNNENIVMNGTTTSELWVEVFRANLKAGTTYALSCDSRVKLHVMDNSNNTSMLYKDKGTASGTFTASTDGTHGVFINNLANESFDNVKINLQIEEGTVATDYEPCTGGIASPNPEYPQPIVSAGQKLENGIVSDVGISKKLTGKNLLKNTATSQTINGVTFTVNEDGSVKVKGTCTSYYSLRLNRGVLFPDGDYVLSKRTVVYLYDDNWDDSTVVYYNNSSPYFSIGERKNVEVIIWVSTGTTYDETVYPMIRLASIEDDTYEPYTEQTLTLNRVLRGIPVTDASLATYTDENGQMWCADEIDVERGVLVQNIGTVLPTEWELHNVDSSSSGYRFKAKINGIVTGITKPIRYVPCVCSHYLFKKISSYSSSGDYITTDEAHEKGSIFIRTTNEELSTTAKFTEWATAENMLVNYILATPIETPLTDAEIAAYKALHTNKPTTVITNDAGCFMEVEYVADTKNHIEQNYVPVTAFNDVLDRISALEQLHV